MFRLGAEHRYGSWILVSSNSISRSAKTGSAKNCLNGRTGFYISLPGVKARFTMKER
jgi:hypothetical protein